MTTISQAQAAEAGVTRRDWKDGTANIAGTAARAGEKSPGSASILQNAAEQSVFARDNLTTTRTIARYRAQPDGLPWFMWSGKVFIPLDEGREWLKRRIRHPNQRRRAA